MRHSQGYYDQNKVEMWYYVDYPESLVFADSDKVAVNARVEDIDHLPNYNQAVQLSVTDTAAGKSYYEVRYTGYDGKVGFDIARYLQILLGDLYAGTVYDYSNDSAVVLQKVFTITLTTPGAAFFTATFEACRGKDKAPDRWWLKKRQVKFFKNYPFTVDMPLTDIRVITQGGSVGTFQPSATSTLDHPRMRMLLNKNTNYQRIFAVSEKNGFCFVIAKSSDTGHVEGSSMLTESTDEVLINSDTCPVDSRAIYLRWLNAHGEMCYWLFHPYRDTRAVSSTVHQRAEADPTRFVDAVRDDGRIHEGTMKNELIANTGFLQGWEYDLVSTIFNANYADMLDMESFINESAIRWTRCLVKPGTYQHGLKHRNESDNDSQIAVTLDLGEERSLVL